VAPSDAAEKNRNTGAQLQSLLYTTAPKVFRKTYLLYDFLVRTNLFFPSHFWTTDANFDNCCQRYIATCEKIAQVHIYNPGSKVLQLNFF